MRVNGKMIKDLGKDIRFIKMEILIKACFKIINHVAKGPISGKTERATKENGSKAKNKELVSGKEFTTTHMLESGKIIKCMDMEFTSGPTVISTKANGFSL